MSEQSDDAVVPNDSSGLTFGELATSQELFTKNLDLADRLARRYAHRGEELEDLLQVARTALFKAAQRYDDSRGVEFAAFATPSIIGELKRHFRDHAWAVRVPRRLQELSRVVNITVSDLNQSLGRSPTVAEIANECGSTIDEVVAAREAGYAFRTYSFDELLDADEGLSLEVPPLESENATDAVSDEMMRRIAHLSDRHRAAVRFRFIDELSQTEIAGRLGVSQMQVSRLLRESLSTLRKSF